MDDPGRGPAPRVLLPAPWSDSCPIGDPMRPIAFALALIAVGSSCSREPASSPGVARQAIVIRVAGMQKGEGGKT